MSLLEQKTRCRTAKTREINVSGHRILPNEGANHNEVFETVTYLRTLYKSLLLIRRIRSLDSLTSWSTVVSMVFTIESSNCVFNKRWMVSTSQTLVSTNGRENKNVKATIPSKIQQVLELRMKSLENYPPL